MIVAIAPLHREYGLRELVLASYQAVSGAGQIGVDTLHDQLSKVAGDRVLGSRPGNVRQAVGDDLGPFPAPLALNVVPWAGSLKPTRGWSSEELKMRNESRKILGLPDLKVSATCVRVPVVTGHSVAVHAVFGTEVDAEGAREVLRNAPGVILVDDPAAGEFPMPIDAVGTDPSWVGRIRRSMDDPRALDLFVTGDNLRKGAALNTAQIAELLAAELAAPPDGDRAAASIRRCRPAATQQAAYVGRRPAHPQPARPPPRPHSSAASNAAMPAASMNGTPAEVHPHAVGRRCVRTAVTSDVSQRAGRVAVDLAAHLDGDRVGRRARVRSAGPRAVRVARPHARRRRSASRAAAR